MRVCCKRKRKVTWTSFMRLFRQIRKLYDWVVSSLDDVVIRDCYAMSVYSNKHFSSQCRVSLNAAPSVGDQTRSTCNAPNRFAHAPLPPYFDLRFDNRTIPVLHDASDVRCMALIARLKAFTRTDVWLIRVEADNSNLRNTDRYC